jgi:hypothetical protein
MSRARAIAVMALSFTALRALPAQERAVHATTAVMPRPTLVDPRERAAEQWTSRGRALYDSNRYRESIASFERALQLRAGRPDEHAWNIARAYAHLGNRKQALRWLSHALEMGFPHRDAIDGEAAFDPYRGDARYKDILENAGKPVPLGWNAGWSIAECVPSTRAPLGTATTTEYTETTEEAGNCGSPHLGAGLRAQWPAPRLLKQGHLGFTGRCRVPVPCPGVRDPSFPAFSALSVWSVVVAVGSEKE